LLSGLVLIMAVTSRLWRIAGVAVLAIGFNVWPMYGAFFGTATPPPPNARAVRVAEFNVNIANDNLAGIAAYLESLQADVVVLEELSPSKADQLAALLPRLPHRYLAEPDNVWGVVILSRWPLLAPQAARQNGQQFAARADVDLGDRKFRLYGSHLKWPVLPTTADVRNAQLQALGRELAECRTACVAVGDFNVTPWSSHFRDVLQGAGVRDCAAGRGLLTTWSSGLPAMLRIRIDQCLVAGAVSVSGVRVGASLGRPYLPLPSAHRRADDEVSQHAPERADHGSGQRLQNGKPIRQPGEVRRDEQRRGAQRQENVGLPRLTGGGG